MPDRIRIMHFRRTSGVVGGPETLIVSVAKYIDRSAFDLTAVDFGRTRNDRSPTLQDVQRHGARTDAIPAVHKFDFSSIRHLAGLLDEHRIDILHTHDHRSNFIGYWATRRRPTPIVVTFHQPLRRYWWLRHIEILDEHIVRRFDRVLPVADMIRREIIAKAPRIADRVITVLNGVDLDLFRDPPQARERIRRELGIPNDATVCATIGRIMEDKGLTYLVDAHARIAAQGVVVHQLLVGNGPQETELRERVARLGLSDRIHFTGFRRDVAEILDAADLLVVSSLSEGLSVAIIEAMAAGRAVVATRVGGTPEIVNDGVGILVEPRDPAGLADAIIALTRDADRRRQLGVHAREIAFQKWSVERMVRDFETVYRGLLRNAN
ncbi:MAG: glycosyltransferase family 4 protein [Phycisphaerales bacterium]|nr:glycosyltransferase family 4 protein [Phycisphaerales bacterium]